MKAIIFLNGEYDYENGLVDNLVEKKDFIFCADGGSNYAYKYKKKVNYIVGDLDSIDKNVLEYYKNTDCIIEKYPIEKDFTDFELILQKIKKIEEKKDIKFKKIYVLGGLGGRIDMTLNNLNLMEKYKNLTFLSKNEEIFFEDKSFEIKNKKGYEFSIILLDEIIENLSLKGFKYEVDEITVERKESRLVSNTIMSKNAKISFSKGKILGIFRN